MYLFTLVKEVFRVLIIYKKKNYSLSVYCLKYNWLVIRMLRIDMFIFNFKITILHTLPIMYFSQFY